MPRLLRLLTIRVFPTDIPFQVHVQLCSYILVVVVVSYTYPDKNIMNSSTSDSNHDNVSGEKDALI